MAVRCAHTTCTVLKAYIRNADVLPCCIKLNNLLVVSQQQATLQVHGNGTRRAVQLGDGPLGESRATIQPENIVVPLFRYERCNSIMLACSTNQPISLQAGTLTIRMANPRNEWHVCMRAHLVPLVDPDAMMLPDMSEDTRLIMSMLQVGHPGGRAHAWCTGGGHKSSQHCVTGSASVVATIAEYAQQRKAQQEIGSQRN